MNQAQLKELLLQSLQHEKGGIQVYEAALTCVQHEGLKHEFNKYLQETRNHERILLNVFHQLKLDPEEVTPGRQVVKLIGSALVQAMKAALEAGNADTAQLVAGECVVLAETKDHANWELISRCADKATGEAAKALSAAAEEVEDQEDEHLYHSKGWTRELWLKSLGLKAMLPPPEERKHVKSAIGAARAEQQSEANR